MLLVLNTSNYPQKIGSWITADSLNKARKEFSGIQLDDKNFLICGGVSPDQGRGSDEVEIFNLETMQWNFAPSMNKIRLMHSLVKFSNGDIFAIGGFKEKSCEIFDYQNQEWSNTDSLKFSMYWGWNTTVLNNDDVLITGGYNFNLIDSLEIIKNCQRYDYLNGKWYFASNLNTGRYNHTSTLLKNGKVLVTGGKVYDKGRKKTNTCELYDPLSNEWSYVAPMHYERAWHSATLLENGKVLVVGGDEQIAELYDPDLDKWEDKGEVNLALEHNRAIILGHEEYLLIVHDFMGWELFSLNNFQSVYFERFEKLISRQVVLKLDDNRVLLAGGEETIESDDPILRLTSFCTFYDYNITEVKTSDEENNSQFDLITYPNPSNGNVKISLDINSPGWMTLKIYDILGHEIETIHNNFLYEGKHIFNFGFNKYSSGVYFLKAQNGINTTISKLIHQK